MLKNAALKFARTIGKCFLTCVDDECGYKGDDHNETESTDDDNDVVLKDDGITKIYPLTPSVSGKTLSKNNCCKQCDICYQRYPFSHFMALCCDHHLCLLCIHAIVTPISSITCPYCRTVTWAYKRDLNHLKRLHSHACTLHEDDDDDDDNYDLTDITLANDDVAEINSLSLALSVPTVSNVRPLLAISTQSTCHQATTNNSDHIPHIPHTNTA
jgi:hypothetical protein